MRLTDITENKIRSIEPSPTLYHGTTIERLTDMLLSNSMKAKKSDRGPLGVSFSTDRETALRFCRTKRKPDMRKGFFYIGAIIQIDTAKVKEAGYEFIEYGSKLAMKEMEERVLGSITPVSPFIRVIELVRPQFNGMPGWYRYKGDLDVESVASEMSILGHSSEPISWYAPYGEIWAQRAKALLQHKDLFT